MNRDRCIDCIKGVAIILVMLGHCIVLNGLNTSDPYLYDAIKSVQMPLFMAVSGVLAGISFATKKRNCFALKRIPAKQPVNALLSENLKDLGRMIDKRAVHYLTPFFSWFVIVYLVTHIANKTLSIGNFVTEFIQLLMQTDRGLWFLMTLFIVTLAVGLAQFVADYYSVLSVKMRKKELYDKRAQLERLGFFLGEILFLYVLFFLQGRSGFTFLSPSLTVQYMPFYVIGYISFGYLKPALMEQDEALKNNVVRVLKVGAIISLVAFLYFVIAFDLTMPVDGMLRLLQQMAASLFGTYGLFALIYWAVDSRGDKAGVITKSLSFVGAYTLEIYVLHFRFARLLGLGSKSLTFYSIAGIGWIMAAFIVMSVCTAACIYFFKKVRVLNLILFGK